MAETTRVAVIGAGGWGYQHARAFFEREDTELVAIAGRNPEKTAKRAAAFGTKPYTNIDQMLQAETAGTTQL